jgi:hypothetical protein
MSAARVTVKEAAYLFGVRRKTVQSWIDRSEKLRPVGRRGQAFEYEYHDLAEVEHSNRRAVRLRNPMVRGIVSS